MDTFKSSDEQKTMEITKERELLMAIMFAENPIDRATAYVNLLNSIYIL